MAFVAARPIPADAHWTRLCDVRQGTSYDFIASGTWLDWGIEANATGYERPWLTPFAGLRRVPKAPWFALIGVIDKDRSTAFIIGSELKNWIAPANGELCCFANDAFGMYWNNKGAVELGCTTTAIET
jgi:hypothetical protein